MSPEETIVDRICKTCRDGLLFDSVKAAAIIREAMAEKDAQLTALTQRAEQAERERDELKAAAWCLDKPDDASHQETLNMIDELWSKKVAPITSLLDQSRALAAAEAEVKRLREVILLYDAQLEGLGRDVADAESREQRLREALSNIASPLNYLQELKRLKGDEFDMDWPVAIRLSESVEFLKQIARDSLLAQPDGKEAEGGR